MRQTDSLALVRAGTLPRPGAIGRLVRLLLGLFCLYALWMVVRHADAGIARPLSTLDDRLMMVLVPLFIVNDVVNIGFAKDWGQRPLIVSVLGLCAAALGAWAVAGSFDSPILGLPLSAWLAYFYAHLGVSFVLAALIATPGCEMRAIADLLGRLRGKAGPEHGCPVSCIEAIDAWERRRT